MILPTFAYSNTENIPASMTATSAVPCLLLSVLHPGPDRALFLPGGLLDRAELPDYLDGTLAGE